MENAQLLSDVERLEESLETLPQPTTRPALVAVCGLPGTGNSCFSARLAGKAGLAIPESDALRKVPFPSPGYSAVESARLFQAVHSRIQRLVARGLSVIVDATTLAESHREQLCAIAARARARTIVVELKASTATVRRRLEERRSLRRRGQGGGSDVDWNV